MIVKGWLRSGGSVELADIGEELRKMYRHPVFSLPEVHQGLEMLPEKTSNTVQGPFE